MKNRSSINLVIDAGMMLCMMPLAGIGFLLKFVLLPGKERAAIYGPNVDLYFWGLDRHDWGTIHLYLGYVLLALLASHLLLHLTWIGAVLKKLVAKKTLQSAVILVFLAACLFLLLFAFLIRPEVRDAAPGLHRMHQDSGRDVPGVRGGRAEVTTKKSRQVRGEGGP